MDNDPSDLPSFDNVYNVAHDSAVAALLVIKNFTAMFPFPYSEEVRLIALALIEHSLDQQPSVRQSINNYKAALNKDKTRGQGTLH